MPPERRDFRVTDRLAYAALCQSPHSIIALLPHRAATAAFSGAAFLVIIAPLTQINVASSRRKVKHYAITRRRQWYIVSRLRTKLARLFTLSAVDYHREMRLASSAPCWHARYFRINLPRKITFARIDLR